MIERRQGWHRHRLDECDRRVGRGRETLLLAAHQCGRRWNILTTCSLSSSSRASPGQTRRHIVCSCLSTSALRSFELPRRPARRTHEDEELLVGPSRDVERVVGQCLADHHSFRSYPRLHLLSGFRDRRQRRRDFNVDRRLERLCHHRGEPGSDSRGARYDLEGHWIHGDSQCKRQRRRVSGPNLQPRRTGSGRRNS